MSVCNSISYPSFLHFLLIFVLYPPPPSPTYLPGSEDLTATSYHPQWSHCAVPILPTEIGSLDEGDISPLTCSITKMASNSALRISFNTNLRVSDCSDCCVRWFVTVNGSECLNPAPIEAVVYNLKADNVNIHRAATIAGICSETAAGALGEGVWTAVLNVMQCDGFNTSYNAYTGFQTLSTINIEEMPRRKYPSSTPVCQLCHTDTNCL